MKGILTYCVTKEVEIDFDEETFKNTENIGNFWNNLVEQENKSFGKVVVKRNGEPKIHGEYIKDPKTGKKLFK